MVLRLTSGTNILIDIRTNRTLRFEVENKGRYPAKGTTITLSVLSIGLSNITALDWKMISGQMSLVVDSQIVSNAFTITSTFNNLMPKKTTWGAAPILFSTNIPFWYLRGALGVYSER